jgi:Cytochrome b5-like Heme/Steroid binding domain
MVQWPAIVSFTRLRTGRHGCGRPSTEVNPPMTTAPARLATGVVALALGSTLLVGCSGAPAAMSTTTSQAAPASSSTSTTTTSTSTSTTTTQPASPTPTPVGYTLAMVAQHASPTSCWSVVDNTVYDLTAWVTAHPGGATRIKNMCGKDATSTYTGEHGTQSAPLATLATFKLGTLS